MIGGTRGAVPYGSGPPAGQTPSHAGSEERSIQPFRPSQPSSGRAGCGAPRVTIVTAGTLLAELERLGVSAFIDGPDLVLRGELPAELIERVRACKPAVVELLRWRRHTDGPDYPPPGADLGPPTHLLADMPIICRVHLGDPDAQPAHDRTGFVRFRSGAPGGFRWESLRCRQPEGDGLLGWALIADGCFLSIVRERGVIKTLPVAARLTSWHLKELRR